MKATVLFKEFFNSEKVGGMMLIGCTAISLIIANTSWGSGYTNFWETSVAGHSIGHWINDGLMAIFFLLIGLELEREIYKGELSDIKDAMLPIFAAIGGMLVPAGLFLMLNHGTLGQDGAGIPMATDIAFALGVLSLLGRRIPTSLKVFLTALAVIDDLGAILVIAFFYAKTLVWANLLTSLGIFAGLIVLNRLKVKNLIPYIVGGVGMWYFMLHSGVHATITGVLLAFAIPFGSGGKESPSYVLQHILHKPVAFLVLPVFALANTAIVLESNIVETLSQSYSLGIALGLIVGKPLGIFVLTLAVVKLGWSKLPGDLTWKSIFGVGLLGGIGFTMSIFITLLAFEDAAIVNNAKLAILLSSLGAGVLGYVALSRMFRTVQPEEDTEAISSSLERSSYAMPEKTKDSRILKKEVYSER
ncbi:Na+/H+ antiporter NhaA [Acetobacteroides hydrogenigenes]|uniref:Na(+)/H(+) antiporter NhaA n=1 Tax=Acetobacteroides hydrogenigenes TaxID=979970 RepID=A0A4V2RN21_9BACT|nr:Na+/H+ antiporter NhaA [Acetobacteroides hydrogenigenes]TCN62060.1 NhaA family Na+:H+ antiporter [Acetobacteroides hydrogenigenes]